MDGEGPPQVPLRRALAKSWPLARQLLGQGYPLPRLGEFEQRGVHDLRGHGHADAYGCGLLQPAAVALAELMRAQSPQPAPVVLPLRVPGGEAIQPSARYRRRPAEVEQVQVLCWLSRVLSCGASADHASICASSGL